MYLSLQTEGKKEESPPLLINLIDVNLFRTLYLSSYAYYYFFSGNDRLYQTAHSRTNLQMNLNKLWVK